MTNVSDNEQINPHLERLAAVAEFEEKASAEEPLPGEAPVEEQQAADEMARQEAARHMAKGIVNGMAVGVKMAWDVEYPKETKEEGIGKLAPCLETEGVAPPWLVNLLGRYGKFIECGLWFGAVGFGTYRTVQARNAETEKNDKRPAVQPVAGGVMESGGSFTTAGM